MAFTAGRTLLSAGTITGSSWGALASLKVGQGDQRTEPPPGPVAEAREQLGSVRRLEAAARGEPARDGEMVEGHHGCEAARTAGLQHPDIMVEGGVGESARLRLDPGPLDPEPVGVEAEFGRQGHVLAVAGVAVAGVA